MPHPMNSTQKKLLIILLAALFVLGVVLLVDYTLAENARETEPEAPPTREPETFIPLAPGEGRVEVLGARDPSGFDPSSTVGRWLTRSVGEDRDEIGVYALCRRTYADGRLTLHVLILRTGVDAGADVTAELRRGEDRLSAAVTYTPSGSAPKGGMDLWELTLTLADSEKPELDVLIGGEYADLVLTYTDEAF